MVNTGCRRCRVGGEASAISALEAITTAQTMFAQGDKDKDGQEDFAASLAELSAPAQRDARRGREGRLHVRDRARRGGPRGGLVRVANPTVDREEYATRRFWVDQRGKIYYAAAVTPPVVADATRGGPPGYVVLGK